MKKERVPFEPVRIRETFTAWTDWAKPDEGREYVTLEYNCPKLTAEGRCSIY